MAETATETDSLILLPAGEAAETRWVTIELPGGKRLELKLRPPTFDEWLADAERIGGQQLHRLKTHVVDWRGVGQRVVDTTDPNNHVERHQPVPYSFKDLRRLMGTHTAIAAQVAAAVNKLFRAMGETDAGN